MLVALLAEMALVVLWVGDGRYQDTQRGTDAKKRARRTLSAQPRDGSLCSKQLAQEWQ